jgi:hypothetical protein
VACHPALVPSGAKIPAWANLSTGLGPPPTARRGAAMTFDAQDGYTILFGGLDSTGHTLRDTWAFRSNSWVSLTPAVLSSRNSPPAVAFASMTFDPADGYVLLFGGVGPKGINTDTWGFVRGHWTVITPTSGGIPIGRTNGSMAFDVHDGYALLFGGIASGRPLRDTWGYRGGGWTDLTPANLTALTSPTHRFGASMAYDVAQSTIVLFAGSSALAPTFAAQNDTWEFSGGTWRNVTTGYAPPPRWAAGTAYDATDAQILLIGGIAASRALLSDTWTFQNGAWTNLTSQEATAPSARSAPSLSTVVPGSPSGDLVLLFGGGSTAGGANADTWVFGAGGLGITAPALTPTSTDANLTLSLATAAYGGSGGYTIGWSGLPPGCTSANVSSFTCQPTTPGQYSVIAGVHDGAGDAPASASASLVINPTPTIVGFTVTPFTIYAGVSNVTFIATVVGGTGHLVFNFTGAPPGCTPTNSSRFRCIPTTAGTYSVTVQVVDQVNTSTQASISVLVQTAAPPSAWTATRIGAVVAVAMVVVLVAVLVVRRHRRLRPPRTAVTRSPSRSTLLDEPG